MEKNKTKEQNYFAKIKNLNFVYTPFWFPLKYKPKMKDM